MLKKSAINQPTISTPYHFDDLSLQVINTLEADIETLLNHANLPTPLKEACLYAMTGQGKRVRPLLVACGYHTVLQSSLTDVAIKPTHLNHVDNGNFEINPIEGNNLKNNNPPNKVSADFALADCCRRAMLAVEFLHTYSLIHDDLPCMDDDDLRRGQATCHIKFDEATAMLTGDVLQTLAFEILSADIEGFEPIADTQAAKLLTVFSPRARRMVSGQMLDLNAENKKVSQTELEAIHRDKTGALIEAAVLMGGVCAEATENQLQTLTQFASDIGLAFQVQDDILDVISNTDTLGKPAGSDEGLNKSTYVRLMGVDHATYYAKSLFENAKQVIEHNFNKDNALSDLSNWLWQRQK